jgi:hypothetical protein
MKISKAPQLENTKKAMPTGEMVQGDITYNYRKLAGQKDLGVEMINKAIHATNKLAC